MSDRIAKMTVEGKPTLEEIISFQKTYISGQDGTIELLQRKLDRAMGCIDFCSRDSNLRNSEISISSFYINRDLIIKTKKEIEAME